MDLTPHMPHLHHDPTARGVDRLDHRLPLFDLRIGPQPRRERPAEAFAADPGRLGDDQPGTCALRVIVAHDLGRDGVARRPAARQRCHQDAVGRVDRTELDGIEQAGHRHGFLLL